MKKDVFIISLAMFVVLTIMAFMYDAIIMKIVPILRNDFLNYLFLGIAFISTTIVLFFLISTLYLLKENKRRWILPLWLSFLFSAVLSYFIKINIARPRPFQKGIVSVLKISFESMKNNFNTWNFSFPSLQAMMVFLALPFITKEFKKLKYVWIIFACLVGFSRVYFGVHYLSDVLAGGIIGYLIGYSLLLIEEKKEFGKKLIKKLKIKKIFILLLLFFLPLVLL